MKRIELLEIFRKIIKIEYDNFNEALEILKSIEDDAKYHGYEYDLFRVALIHNISGEYDEALKCLKKSLDIAYANANEFVINEVLLLLAYIHIAKKNYELALKYYLSIKDYQKSPKILNNIGHIYGAMGDNEEALTYYKQAKELYENINIDTEHDNFLKSIIYINLAEVSYKFGKLEDSVNAANDCIAFSRANDDDYGIGSSLFILGKVELEYERYDEAINYFIEASNYFKKCSLMNKEMIYSDIDDCIRWHAITLNKTENYEASISSANLIKKKNKEDYELLIKNFEALNKLDEAYKMYKMYLTTVKAKEESDSRLLADSYKSKVKILENENKINEYELLYNNTKSISEIGRKIISSNNLDDIVEGIYNKISGIMKCETIAVGLLDPLKEILNYNWIYEGGKLIEPIFVSVNNKNRFSSWVVRNKESIKLNEALTGKDVLKYKEEIQPFTHGIQIQSMIICPIMFKDNIYGILSVQSTLKHQYTEYDLEVLRMLSSFIAVAMENWDNKKYLKDANEKLKVLSKTDALTGISNRHVLTEIVEDLFTETPNLDERISVVMIDIDYFKEFNDTYGHLEGDECIVKVVKEIALRLDVNGNQLFRYGGDEFVGILPNLSKTEIEQLLEKTRQSIEDLKLENIHSEICDYITASFGFTTIIKNKNMDYQKAFYLADKALYVAKANGKNQVAFEDTQ